MFLQFIVSGVYCLEIRYAKSPKQQGDELSAIILREQNYELPKDELSNAELI
jgi:hypothetical protein